jgi:hypothetical protein
MTSAVTPAPLRQRIKTLLRRSSIAAGNAVGSQAR